MTIEEEFFKTFEIEPKWKDIRSQNTTIYTEEQAKEIRKNNRNIQLCYPKMTDSILLELMRIVAKKPYGLLLLENTCSTNCNRPKDMALVQFEILAEGIMQLMLLPRVLIRINREEVRALFEGQE